MSAKKEVVVCSDAPAPIGPYSVAIKVGDLVFTAGQTGLDPRTNQLAPGGIEAETRQVLTNIKHVLEAAGTSLDRVVKTTVFLRDMNDFSKMNSIYAEFFENGFPARTTVQAVVPRTGTVEIEVIAALP
jgi:2-iminobutanoate/2-iminopropanoate deaminase